MISKYMRGRLGNQLFQYATIRYIQELNHDDQLCLNFYKYVESKGFENELKYFKVKPYKETNSIHIDLKQILIIFYYKIIKRIIRCINKKEYHEKRYCLEQKNRKKLMREGIYWKEDGYLEMEPTSKKNKVVIGHFESKKNFDSIKSQLLKELEPIHPLLKSNQELYGIIQKTNSVCVSIRRGDFVTNKIYAKKFNVCNISYFKKAIEQMNQTIENPTYIIFSDDIKWCKENIQLDKETYFESGTDPVWEKLRLMYSCKHFIISNSTFSWWAQYLSRNDKKIVIAPSKWSNIGYHKDIYDKDWILVNN